MRAWPRITDECSEISGFRCGVYILYPRTRETEKFILQRGRARAQAKMFTQIVLRVRSYPILAFDARLRYANSRLIWVFVQQRVLWLYLVKI